jgi:hypothetical protein
LISLWLNLTFSIPTKIRAVLHVRRFHYTRGYMRVPYHKLEVTVCWVAPLSKLGHIGSSLRPWDQNMVHGTHFVIHLLLFGSPHTIYFLSHLWRPRRLTIELDGGLGQSSKANLSVCNWSNIFRICIYLHSLHHFHSLQSLTLLLNIASKSISDKEKNKIKKRTQ